jgi:tetratricopeptide (TPR) repeat protein
VNWRSIWDAEFTPRDIQLTAKSSFYLLIPFTVALHEVGHAVAIWAYGLQVIDWQFLGYMGWVLPSASAGSLGDFFIALSGNVVTYLIGLACLLFPLRFPGHPARNVLFFELGRQSMFLVLIFYPLLCIVFNGDFRRIYDFEATPVASAVTGVFHFFILTWGYRRWWKNNYQGRVVLLCSNLCVQFIGLEKRVKSNPEDALALQQLGSLYMITQSNRQAREYLGRVVALGVADAKCKLQYASLLAEIRQTAAAIPLLEEVSDKLLRSEDRQLAERLLVQMQLLGGRPEQALRLAEKMRASLPGDLSVLDIWAKAMVHNDREAEALALIEERLNSATDEENAALRHIYEDLR